MNGVFIRRGKNHEDFPLLFFLILAEASGFEQVFGNLYRVQSRSLFDLVADRPKR